MFFQNPLEQKIQKNEKRSQELEFQNEALNREVKKFFADLNLTPEQIDAFVNNPTNFTEENWQQMQEIRAKIDAKLKLDLDNINNQLKLKQTYANRKIDKHWLFVR